MKKKINVMRCIAIIVLLITVLIPTIQAFQINENQEKKHNDLVVGINIDQLMSRYIPDYDVFEQRLSGVGYFGNMYRWSVKPDPNDPETQYWWGKKRNLPFYRRFIRIDIGVFRSHSDAIQAASDTMKMWQEKPEKNQADPNDVGYESWGDHMFVRDNVYVFLLMSDSFNPSDVLKGLDEDIKNGADGIEKGTEVQPPVIIDKNFPTSIGLWINQRAKTELLVEEPNNRDYSKQIWVHHSESKPILIDSQSPNIPLIFSRSDMLLPPGLRWHSDGTVEVIHREKNDHAVLRAIAVNNRCVVSELWEKEVCISVQAQNENMN